MRALPILWCFLNTASAAVTIDSNFWAAYEPYQQYSATTIRDLIALREGDLLETAQDIDGLELRVVGRSAPTASLISARVVIDSIARQRLQVKVLGYSSSPNNRQEPALTRRLLNAGQANRLTELLEVAGFWDAPYLLNSSRRDEAFIASCTDGNGWIIEAFRPGTYQLISRTNCLGPDETVSEILDFLLGIAGIATEDFTMP